MPSRLRSRLLFSALAVLFLGLVAAMPLALAGGTTKRRPSGLEWAAPVIPRPMPTPTHRAPKLMVPKPTRGERAAAIALEAVGVPYRWGGASPASGFDCSGLVHWAYRRLGIDVPHSSYALYSQGRRVARSRMKPGDVLFFSGLGHVGLYLGRGRMVHAPHSGRNVEVVTLGRSTYGSRLVGARRVVVERASG